MGNERFKKELEKLINKYSIESHSNTPDFILVSYVKGCIDAFNAATFARDRWYDVHLEPGNKYFGNKEDLLKPKPRP